jgi:hypothetical protein
MHIIVIQILIVAFALYALTRTLLRFRKGGIGPAEWLAWSGFWVAVGVGVMAPGLTQWFAGLLGVGRGADAVFYLGLVGLSYAFFRLYLRLRHVEQQLTQLVRQLALKEAEREPKSNPPG